VRLTQHARVAAGRLHTNANSCVSLVRNVSPFDRRKKCFRPSRKPRRNQGQGSDFAAFTRILKTVNKNESIRKRVFLSGFYQLNFANKGTKICSLPVVYVDKESRLRSIRKYSLSSQWRRVRQVESPVCRELMGTMLSESTGWANDFLDCIEFR
jgi:hypothetical protein